MRIAHVITRLIVGGAQENTLLCCQELQETYHDNVLLITGLELSLNSWLVVGVVPLLAYVVYRTTIEEQQLRQNLPGYAAYQMRTKRFVPFVI